MPGGAAAKDLYNCRRSLIIREKGVSRVIDIDRFGEILGELVDELPEEFFDELNLGVRVDPGAKLHPDAIDNDLYILGEYETSNMGNGIVLYYGSFGRLWGHLDEDALRDELRRTLRHEFRHHMEGRAGERGLEIEDEKQLRDYLGKDRK